MQQPVSTSQSPTSFAIPLGFLTVGIGLVRSVEPVELIVRAVVVMIVCSFCIRIMVYVWKMVDREA